MYPNQQSSSIDYLNQIAPQAPKKKWFIQPRFIAIGIGGLILLIILGTAVAALQPDTNLPKQLAARLQSTETIVGGAQSKIKSSSLRALNSSLKIYLTNTNRDITAPLMKDNIDVTKLDKTIVDSEAGTTMQSKLEDARLNAKYDIVYASEMSYRLEDAIMTPMQQIYKTTGNQNLKTVLNTAYTNLVPIQKQFSDYNNAND